MHPPLSSSKPSIGKNIDLPGLVLSFRAVNHVHFRGFQIRATHGQATDEDIHQDRRWR